MNAKNPNVDILLRASIIGDLFSLIFCDSYLIFGANLHLRGAGWSLVLDSLVAYHTWSFGLDSLVLVTLHVHTLT
jgi:hypothetical protein